ncbi:MAG: hypothetical protein ACKOEC_22420 [Acidimicrobiia bacterium]
MTTAFNTSASLYPVGTDYEWFACDTDGCVAVFTTASNGPIPTEVLRELSLVDALQKSVRSLPHRGGATMLVRLPRPDGFLRFASQGLFAYDWTAARGLDGDYEMLARPQRPLRLADLPEEFQPLLRELTLSGVRFANATALNVRKHFACEPTI